MTDHELVVRLVCRHLREQGPESWGFYVDGPFPEPLMADRVATPVTRGEAPLAVLTAPELGDVDDPADDGRVPLDGVVYWLLEVWSPMHGAEGLLEARRFLPFTHTTPTEYVLDRARGRVGLLVAALARREMRLDDAGAGRG